MKGRSSSVALNRELERALPHTIGGGIYSGLAYSPTSINPSDGPTRGRDVGQPTEDLPNWYEALLSGDVGPLDSFLVDHGCDPFALAGVPSLKELVPRGADEVDDRVHVQRRVRSKSLKRLLSKVAAPVVADRLREAAGQCAGAGDDDTRSGETFPGPCRDLACGIGTIIWPDGVEHSECLKNRGYLLNNPSEDLLRPTLQAAILDMIRNRAFVGVGGGPVCASFSRAITPGYRSNAYPRGKPGIPEKAQQRGRLYAYCVRFSIGTEHSFLD